MQVAEAGLRSQFGRLVRYHRERAGMTQAQLAERTDKSVQLIGRIERGSAAPSFETLALLANALAVEVRDLFGSAQHAAERPDPLGKLVHRVAGLDAGDLEWVLALVDLALTRRAQR